jgi:hypothetical protein
MENKNILFIDNNKFYWDSNNECLIPYELIVNNTNLELYIENYDIDFWENILSRKLNNNEKKIFYQIWNEKSLNLDIKMLQKNILNNHCYIKSITNNIGNCLFESLASLDLGDNDLGIISSEMIRKNLASLLLSVKSKIGFFPKLPYLTPEEIFTNNNDIGFVTDVKTNLVYQYDYDMMIYDLNSNYSWQRLPTEFLLMTISRIYNIEILIYHNKTNYINRINACDELNINQIDKIRLGQINEEHYFPLLELSDELKNDDDIIQEILNTEIKYDNYINKFKKWSKLILESTNFNQ